ncbi:MAG: glycosyltransferase, partial [Bacteroidota bacterium]
AAADLLVAPSPFEPFGMIYLEGMASGKPVIGCRSGGVPEVVRHGTTGLLVPPSDPGSLAEAMSRLLSNRDLRLDIGTPWTRSCSRPFLRGRDRRPNSPVLRTRPYVLAPQKEALSC